jgi:uncharacterized protein with HEPN domain
MSNTTVDFLKHILNEIDFLQKETKGMSFADFIKNEKDKRAFSRSLQIIGEAIKNLPNELREQYSDIDWKPAAGLRDRIVHGYFNVDFEIIWDVIQTEIPILKHQIETIIQDLEE